ncbi:gustatory receptor [Homalodisca vitripennis]|nr:gustatory receptor [Homalodisca vitripennis]
MMLSFCRVVGGLPMKYTSDTRRNKRITFSYAAFVWSSAFVVIQEVLTSIVLWMYFIGKLEGQSLRTFSRTADIVLILDVVSLQVVVAVVFLSSAWKYPRLVRVFATLELVYCGLQHKTSEIKAAVKILGICAVTAISTTIYERIGSVINDRITAERISSFVLSFIPMILMHCSQAALFVHFTHVTQSIANSFRMVNARMEKEIVSYIVDGIETNHSLPDVNVIHPAGGAFSKIKKLRTLMNTYWMLCDAVHQVNVFYGDQLMAVIFSAFIHITIKFYFLFLNVTTGKVFLTISEGAWILTYICFLVVLVNSSTDVTNSANETGQMICKLINKDLDPILSKQLEGFLLQLPHHNARFSALGFFQLHNETLTGMAGAVTTYLVILIQFQAPPTSS